MVPERTQTLARNPDPKIESIGKTEIRLWRGRNFKTRPYWIGVFVDGWHIGTFWSENVKVQRRSGNRPWVLTSAGIVPSFFFIHADEITFEEDLKEDL